MEIVISKSLIGSDHHLSYDGTDWTWLEGVPEKSVCWGFENHRDLRSAAESLHLKVDLFESTPWGRSQSHLVDSISNVRWIDCMPRRVWKKKVTEAARQLWLNFTCEDNSYYVTTHLRNREIVWQLSRPYVDVAALRKRMQSSNDNIKRSLAKFLPESGDICPPFKYSLSKSVTGRMTINDGPNILTMKKSDRSIFKSRYSDGALVEVDLVSAEPRVALSLFGKHVEGDVYEDLIQKGKLNITRADAKIATLSALYGASHHTIKARISEPHRSAEILDLVKDHFGVSHIQNMICDQHKELGYIKNTHGRKIFSNPPSLNHFIQSSTVDVSFDIFQSLLKLIKDLDVEIMLDIRLPHLEKLVESCKSGLYSPTIGANFPVKLKEIQ